MQPFTDLNHDLNHALSGQRNLKPRHFQQTIAVLNINKINEDKRDIIYDAICEGSINIAMLSETRVENHMLNGHEDEGDHEYNEVVAYQTPPSSRGGVMTIHQKCSFNRKIKYINHNLLYTTYRKNGQILHLINCYFPPNKTKETRQLLKNLLSTVDRIKVTNPRNCLVVGGDFNASYHEVRREMLDRGYFEV